MPTYSSWKVSGASIDYVPIENPVNETVKLFNGKEQGSVPPTTNLSSNTGQYILAQDGTWIPQPSFTSGGSDAFEILRPSVLTPTYSAYTPTVTNSANAYDVDTNHATTFGEWECAFVSRNLPITDTLLFTAFGSKTQTWTSATINISRAYGYFNDGESNSSSKVTSVKVEFSTNGGTSWTTIVTDLSTAVPLTATTSSYTFTTTPTMGNVQVRLTLVRGGGGLIYEPEIKISVPGSTGDIDLRLYDIWISGTYSGGSGNITCNNLTVTGDATFQSKIYDSTASAGTTGQVLKVAANGKVTWATDTVGTGTVTSITTTGANGVTISGGSTQTITTSGTFALALGNITPTSISTGTGSFSGDVEFAASIKSPNGSNSPIVISPDGTGDLHVNADSLRLGDNNADATIATNGTGDLILTTHEGSATEGVIRLYDGANGNITLTPNGTGQVQVGTDQVVTLAASQTLTNKSISGSANTLSNIANASLTNSTISGVALGSNLNALTITSPLTGTSFNGSSAVSIGIPVATTSANGYLSSTDWTTFNNKGSGTVTSVTGGTYLTGGTITTTGTLAVDATSANTASKVVARDASGNFSAGTITATLSGSAPAGSLSGATLASGVTASSLTSVGTLTGLTVSGTTSLATSSGYSQIGTTSNYTSSKLQVYGNIDLVNTSTSQYIRFYDGTTFNGGLGTDNWVGGSSANLTLVSNGDTIFRTTGSATERMRIVGSTGNVLINTTSALTGGDSTLAVNGSIFSVSGNAGIAANAAQGYTIYNLYYGGSPAADRNRNTGFSGRWTFDLSAGFLAYKNTSSSSTAGSAVTETERMRIDSSGNVGIGVTPSSWGASRKAIELGYAGSAFYIYPNTSTALGSNHYVNSSGNNIYSNTGYGAALYNMYSGEHQFYVAGSGTAGNTITFTQAMTLTSGGNLLIGNTNGTEKLTVTGKIKASDVLLGNNGTKGYGAITTTTSTSTPTGGSSGDHYYIY